jgi:calcineurin-like phosphoesterase family protein
MKYAVIGDPQFSHKKLIELGRPADFEDKIKRNLINANLELEDVLIVVGDICIGNDEENNNWFRKNLMCNLWLVRGNHDSKSISWYLNHGWNCVVDRLDLNLFGKRLIFTHEPISEYDIDMINIHGHLHGGEHKGYGDWIPDLYHINVAADFTGFAPVFITPKLFKRYYDEYE